MVEAGRPDPLRVIPEVHQVAQHGARCPKRSSCGLSQIPRVGFHTARGCTAGGCGLGVALLIVVSFEAGADRGCGEQPADVLDDDPLRLQLVDRGRHVRPQAGARAGDEASHLPNRGNVLTRKATAQYVDWRDTAPIDGGDVTQVGSIRPVVGEDAHDGFVDLGEPDRSGVEDFFDGEVESAIAAEQRSDP